MRMKLSLMAGCILLALGLSFGNGAKVTAEEVTVPETTVEQVDTVIAEGISQEAELTDPDDIIAANTIAQSELEAEAEVEEEEVREYTKAELRLMSAIIFAEAGSESYKGKVAVGSVIMNRVESSKYPKTVKGVVYQSGQFSPTWNGALNRALSAYDNGKFTSTNHKQCVKAAKAVLTGTNTMEGYLYFMAYSGRVARLHPTGGKRIMNQWFFKKF